ncbi:MAG: MBL fold metallo-hydrolase [Dethiobacteria bacterium]
MGGLFLGVGLLGFFVSLILLIVNAVKKNPLKRIAIALLISFLMFCVGGVLLPPSDEVAGVGDESAENGKSTVDSLNEQPGEPGDESNKGGSNDVSDETNDQGKKAAPPSATAPSGQIKVHFLDVGQGDSVLVQTPEKNILIDGGSRTAGATVVGYLKSLGITKLDIIIGTHPHEDHIGGLIPVLESIPVGEVIDPGVVHTTKTFEDYLTIIDQKDIRFTEGRAGMIRDLGGGASLQIMHPSSPSGSNLNNVSIVTRATFGQISFLFSGDAESTAEFQILSRGYTLASTILKVGHHGSRSATSQAYINAVKPKAAVIMCGTGNSYGHPHDETLAKLSYANVNIYRTDKQGTIVITTDGKSYNVNKEPFSYQQKQQPPPKTETSKPKTEPKPAPVPQPDPEPEPKPSPTPVEGAYVGSAKSNTYHYPSCRYVKNILVENKVWFGTVYDAQKAGYTPCKVCNPR